VHTPRQALGEGKLSPWKGCGPQEEEERQLTAIVISSHLERVVGIWTSLASPRLAFSPFLQRLARFAQGRSLRAVPPSLMVPIRGMVHPPSPPHLLDRSHISGGKHAFPLPLQWKRQSWRFCTAASAPTATTTAAATSAAACAPLKDAFPRISGMGRTVEDEGGEAGSLSHLRGRLRRAGGGRLWVVVGVRALAFFGVVGVRRGGRRRKVGGFQSSRNDHLWKGLRRSRRPGRRPRRRHRSRMRSLQVNTPRAFSAPLLGADGPAQK